MSIGSISFPRALRHLGCFGGVFLPNFGDSGVSVGMPLPLWHPAGCLLERPKGTGRDEGGGWGVKSCGSAPSLLSRPSLPLFGPRWKGVQMKKGAKMKKKKKKKERQSKWEKEVEENHSTQDSHVVPHHGTNWAALRLTAQIGRDAVLSESYGRGCRLVP